MRPVVGGVRVADGDGEGHPFGVLQGVEGDAQRRGVGQWPQAELDEVGRVVGEDRIGGIAEAPGLGREQIGLRRLRIVGVCRAGRAVVVVEPVLVQEFAAAIGAGAGDEDGQRLPDARVLQLRRAGRRQVERLGAGPRG